MTLFQKSSKFCKGFRANPHKCEHLKSFKNIGIKPVGKWKRGIILREKEEDKNVFNFEHLHFVWIHLMYMNLTEIQFKLLLLDSF